MRMAHVERGYGDAGDEVQRWWWRHADNSVLLGVCMDRLHCETRKGVMMCPSEIRIQLHIIHIQIEHKLFDIIVIIGP